MSVFKDFPGLKNLEKKFKDFQGPARALLNISATAAALISITTHTLGCSLSCPLFR